MKLLHPHHVIFLLSRVINHSQIKQEVHFRIDSKQFVSMSDTCWWDWLVNRLRCAGGNMAVLLCFIRAANWALQAEASSAKVAHLFFFFFLQFCVVTSWPGWRGAISGGTAERKTFGSASFCNRELHSGVASIMSHRRMAGGLQRIKQKQMQSRVRSTDGCHRCFTSTQVTAGRLGCSLQIGLHKGTLQSDAVYLNLNQGRKAPITFLILCKNVESVAEKLSQLQKKCYGQRCVFNFPGLADAFRFVLAVKREAHTRTPSWQSELFFYKGHKCY